MPEVQIQRFDRHGRLLEFYNKDLPNHRAYLDEIEPLDRLAREEGGCTQTVSPGARLYIGGWEPEERDE